MNTSSEHSHIHSDMSFRLHRSLYIAAFLSTRGAYGDRSRDTWPRFLDAAAIVVAPDGSRRYALVRSGLSDGIVGVGPTPV